MAEDAESSSFLSRTYKIAKLIAVATASIVGFIISLIALDVSKGHWWVDVKFPLYATVLVITVVFAISTAVLIWLALVVRAALDSRSFYRNEVKSLRAKVSTLRDMAYNDPITGIPNSNKLKEDIETKSYDKPRCLILLDLKNFGQVNKRHNHWIGDEYLRRFSQMVTESGRRNEFLFKKRPENLQRTPTEEVEVKDEVKAFRKNAGGDEFFILLEGTIVDGLGYLNRLIKRHGEFERMAFEIMGESYAFGFSAGIVSIAYDEPYDSVLQRVSECLGLATEKDSKRDVYWIESELPADRTPVHQKILEETDVLFGKQSGGQAPHKPI
jgi:GGDEF domain-containing protein